MSVEAMRTAGVSRGKATVGLTERVGDRLGGGTGRRSCPASEGEVRKTAERRNFLKFILKTIASLG